MAHPSLALKRESSTGGRSSFTERGPALPDGQEVSVEIRPIEALPSVGWSDWLSIPRSDRVSWSSREHASSRRIWPGSRKSGCGDDELLGQHLELTPEDVAAIRQYALVPSGLRRAFGGWAEDSDELDEYLEWTRRALPERLRPWRWGSELPLGHGHLFGLPERKPYKHPWDIASGLSSRGRNYGKAKSLL